MGAPYMIIGKGRCCRTASLVEDVASGCARLVGRGIAQMDVGIAGNAGDTGNDDVVQTEFGDLTGRGDIWLHIK